MIQNIMRLYVINVNRKFPFSYFWQLAVGASAHSSQGYKSIEIPEINDIFVYIYKQLTY